MNSSPHRKIYPFVGRFGIAVAMAVFALAPASVFAANQTWDGSDSNDWSTPANWVGNAVPGSTSVTNSADVATFDATVANNQIVIDANRNISGLTFNGSSGNYTIGTTAGNALHMTSCGTILMGSGLTNNKTITINAPLLMYGTGLTINNVAPNSSNKFLIGGNISSNATSGTQTLSITSNNTRTTNVNEISGLISNGNSGGTVAVTATTAGSIWYLTNNSNSFTGNMSFQGGAVYVSTIGDQGVASAVGMGSTLNFGSTTSGGSLYYIGNGNTTNRIINLAGTTGGANIYANNASGLLKFTSDFTVTGNGSKSLVLRGTGAGEIAGTIVNSALTGATVATAASTSNTTLALASVDGLTVGNGISGTGIAGGTTISAIDAANKRVTLSAAATVAIGATITSSGLVNITSVTKNDAGTWTLSGNNTYTGATTVSAGTLVLSGNLSGSNVVVSGASAVFNQTSTGGIAGSGTTFTLTNGNATLAGANTYTGATTITAGTLSISSDANLSGTSSALVFDGGTLRITGTALTSLNATRSTAFNATKTVGLNIADAANTFTVSQALTQTSGGLTKSGDGTLLLSGNNTYTGNTTVSAGTLRLGHANALGATTSSLAVNGGTLDLNGNSITTAGLSGSSGDITSVSAATLTINNTSSASFSGTLSGNLALLKTSNGTLTLGGSNTYTGGTILRGTGSRLNVSHISGLGTGNVTVESTGLPSANTGAFVDLRASTFSNNFTINGQGTANGAIQGNANSTLSGLVTLAGDAMIAIRSSGGNNTLTLTGGITSGGTNRTLTLNTYGNATVATNQLTISGNSVNLGTGGTLDIGHGIQAGGTGTFNLNVGNNTWGTTIVRGSASASTSTNATLNLGAANALGSSSSVLQLGNATTALEGIIVNLNGNNQTIGGLRSFGSTGSASANGTRTVTSANATTLTIDNSSATNYLYDGVISGNISLVKNGTGAQTLSGNNTYTGTTTINAGALTITSNSSLPGITTNGRYSVASGATLGVYNAVTDADIASMLGTTNFADGSAIGFDTTSGNRTYSSNLTNTLQGALGLTKLGSNTLTLSGASANTYTGTTTVSAGTLTLDKTSEVVAVGGDLVLNGSSKLLYGTSKNEQIANTASITINGTQSVFNGSTWGDITGANTFNETIASLTIRDGQFNTGTTSNWTVTGAGVFDGSSGDARFAAFSGTSISFNSLSLTAMTGTTIATSGDSFVLGGNQPNATTLTVGSGGLILNGSTLGLNKGVSSGNAGSRLILDGNITTTGSSDSFIASNLGTVGISNILLSDVDGSIVTRTITTGSGANLTISVPITNGNATTAGIIKEGLGTLTLSGNNTYNGTTMVSAGTLNLSTALALQNSTIDTSGAGVITLSSVTAPTFGGLSGSGNLASVITTGYSSVTGITLNPGSGTSNTYSGVISDGAAGMTLTKSGAGTQVLSGNNTYTGGTILTNGNLIMGADNALGNGALTFNPTTTTRLNINSTNQTITGLTVLGSSASVIQNEAAGGGTGTVTFNIADGVTSSSASNFYFRDSSTGVAGLGKLALVKTGNGTLDFSTYNATNYSGGLTVNGGVFSYNATAALGNSTAGGAITLGGGTLNYTGSSSLTVANNATLTDGTTSTLNNAAGTVTVSGTIGGSGGLTKSGAGTLTLSRNNTYTGGTTITTGTIMLGADGAIGNGNLTFAPTANAFLNLNGKNQTVTGLTVQSGFVSIIQNNLDNSTGTITFDIASGISSSTSNFSVRNQGTGTTGKVAVVKTGAGTLDFSTYDTSRMNYTAGLTVNGGTLSYNAAAALGNSTAGGAITLGGGTLNYTGSSSLTVANNATLTDGTTSTLNNAAGTVTVSSTIAGSGNLIKSGAGTLALSGANTYNGSTTINAGTLQIGAGSTTGALSIGSAIINNGTLTFNRTNTVTQGTDFASDISGTGALIQAGSGNLILTGANTYIGATTISAGTLQIGGGGTTGNLSTTSAITNNGTLVFNRSNTIAQGTDFANVISGSGSVTQAGAGTLILSGANTFNGGVTINAGTLQLGNAGALNSTAGSENAVTFGASSTGALSLNGNSVVIRSLATNATPGTPVVENANAAAATLTVGNSANASSTYAGLIQDGSGGGALSLTKAGTGTLTLSGNNTYTGATTISAGTLSISHANALGATGAGSGTTIASSASLQLSNNITIGETILLNSTGISNSGGIRSTGGNNTISGAITAGAAPRIVSTSGNLTLSGGYTGSGLNLTLGATANNTSITVTGNAITLGSGTLNSYSQMANGNSLVILAVAGNSFGGVRVDTGGTIRTDVANAWNSSANMVLGTTESSSYINRFDLNGNSQTVASLNSANDAVVTNTITSASAATLTVNGSTNTTYNGTITGAVSLVKEGSSRLTLGGNNTYTGATTITAGTITLTGSNTGSATAINSGGTLIGTGTAGAVTVNSGGSIGAGSAVATPGTLTVGSLTLNGGSGYTWDFGNVSGTPGTNWDLITATNTTINADSTNKFTIFITGNPTGWSPTTNYASGWNILQWGTLNSFDANAFIVNSDNFTGAAPTGSWTINSIGGYLNISYTAPAATGIWTAGSGNWSNNTNWSAGSAVPQNTSPLEFSGAGGVSTNDNQLNTVGGITFTSGAGAYTLNGTALTIRGGGITNNSTSAQTVAMDITMADSQAFNAGAANLTVSGAIANAGFNLEASGNNTVSISGNISGSGGVAKIGNGTLILSGDNSYTGATTISAGALNIQHANALGTTAGGTTVSATGAALQLQGDITVGAEALSLTGNGVSSSTGALRNISGSNTFGGPITIGGTTQINSDAGLLTLSGGMSTSSQVTFGGAASHLVSGNVSGSGSIRSNAASVRLTLSGANTFTGNLVVDAGTVTISSIGNAGEASAAGAGSAISISAAQGTGTLVYTGSAATSNKTIALSGGPGRLMTITQNGTGLLKFTSNVTSTSYGFRTLVLGGSGSGEMAGAIVDSASGTTMTTATVGSGNTTLTLASVDGVSVGSSISGATIANGTTITALSGNIATLSNATTGNVTGFTTILTIPGVTNPTGVTKNGTGTWTLSGANTYTGNTTISAGALNIQHANALGTTARGTTVASGAALELQGDITVGAEALSLTGTGVSTTGALRSISGNNTYGGAITLAGATRINSDADMLTLSGGISGTQNLTIGGAGNTTISSAIATSTGTLTKDGAGTLILSANNTYTGNTTVSLGVINIQHANGLGTTANGTTVSSGAALQLQGGITVGAEALSLNGTGVSTDGALRNISGSNTYGGAITLAGATRINSDADLLTLSGGIGGTQNLTIGGAGNTTISSAIATSTGTLTKDGLGTLVLSGNNTYSGTTTVTAGTLQLGHANALGATTSGLVVNGTLDLNGNSITKSTLSGETGNITSVSAATLTFNRTNAAIGTYNGTIGGDVALSITNSNTSGSSTLLTLGGSNTYTGNTTIYNSALAITNGAALGNSTVIVQKGGQSTADYGGQIRLSGGITVSNNMTLAGQGYGGYNGALRNNSGNNTYTGTITIAASETTTRITSASGTLTLNGTISLGAATYGNLFQHAGGDIRLGGNGITGSATSFNVLGGGSNYLITDRANAWAGTTGLTLGSSGSTSYGRVDLNGNDQTISTITAGGNATTNDYFNNIITNRSGTLATLTVNSSSTNSTFAGTLSGNLALTKAGSRSLILTANNTYTGTTTISAGNLSISTVSAVGSTSGINLANATTLIYTGSAATLDRAISVTGTTGSTGTIRNESAGLLTLSGTLSKNGTTLALQGGNGGITVSGSIVGSNANSDLIIDGGSVTLAAANTYNGPTTIKNGATLNANISGALPIANGRSDVLIDPIGSAGSTLVLGASQSVASLTGAASSNVTLGSNTITIGNTSGNTTYAGRITGGSSSALVKDGASTQVLTGNNTGFTGTTTINSGTLQAASAGALGGTSKIDITGGTLLVTVDDAINGKNIELGGSGVGLQFSGNYSGAIGNLTLSANSIIDLGAGSVQILFQGLTSSNHTLSFYNWSGTTLWNGGNGTTDTDKVYFGPDLSDEALAKIYFYSGPGDSFLGSGFELMPQTTFEGTPGYQIIPVPEPETYATGLLLLLGGAWWMWKRNRKSEACSHGTLLPCGGKGK